MISESFECTGEELTLCSVFSNVQLDIEIVFDYPDVSKVSDEERNVDEHFHSDLNAQAQGTFGPFGLLVLADKELQEQSAVFFYLSHSKKLGWTTKFYSDPTRSTLAEGIDTSSYGAVVTVLPSEDFLSARILVDRTVIESFVQGGRMTMNTRSYPTVAYDRNALVFLFNNGTQAVNVRSLQIWQMQTCTNLSI
jgi:beta-fructofuranosidase